MYIILYIMYNFTVKRGFVLVEKFLVRLV